MDEEEEKKIKAYRNTNLIKIISDIKGSHELTKLYKFNI